MRVNVTKLRELEHLLRASCHAPGCDTVKSCPNQCKCRHRRRFKLNTETAICWQIADNIFNTFRWKGNPRKDVCVAINTKTDAYYDIARFHMSKGWENFFLRVRNVIWYSTMRPEYLLLPKYTIEGLTKTISRLKREPRDLPGDR